MFIRASAVLAAASLLSTTSALPTTERPSSTLTLRDNGECPAGKNYYVCNIGDFHYKGCCSVDPCTLKAECPDDKPAEPPAPTCKPGSQGNKAYQPVMKTIVPPREPIVGQDLHISKSDTSEIAQMMTFKLPKEAKNCFLLWSIPAPAERDFKVTPSGLTHPKLIDENGQVGESVGGADFTNWPQYPGSRVSNVGSVPCSEDLSLWLSLDQNGEVYLKQNEETGFYIQYNC